MPGDPGSAAPPPDWAAVRRLFDAALERPEAERPGFVAAAGEAPEVRREVASLLAHAPVPESFLADAQPTREGERCGAWQLVRLLGRGGMGDVYEARRVDGAFDGRAAVKLLRHGQGSASVLRRFAAERQALARLNHPHIARLYDAGLTADGLPFFVMEQVHGRPIDVAAAGLPVARQLALFLQLADAVAHAHRNLLLHRDLKPGNVLVDDEGQVKLLDFGIAKAIDPLEGDDPGATLAGERPYTPQYASPEQVRGEPVGTATDVYSLGVLLYQVLTGERPYGRDATTAHAAARAVLDEPPAPARQLGRDLDNILRRALQKAPDQRYPSVEAFAADLRAHLAGQPVSARRQSAAYVLSRVMVRHRAASAIAGTGLLALVAGLVIALWQVRALEQAHRSAENRLTQVRQLAHGLVFRYHDQIVHLPGSIPVREALLQEASRYLDGLLAEAPPDPGLAREVAETYQRIAILQGEQFSPSQERLDEAARNLDKALALLPLYVDAPDVDPQALNHAADMWMTRATLHQRASALSPARAALARAHALTERAARRAPEDLQTASRLATLDGRLGLLLGGGAANANLGRVQEALHHLLRSEQGMAAIVHREPGNPEWVHQWAWACQQLARGMTLAGRDAEGVQWGERAVTLRDQAYAAQPGNAHFRHQTATARMALAFSLVAAGEFERALALQAQSASMMAAVAHEDPGNQAAARDARFVSFTRAVMLVQAGREREARPLLAQAIAELPVDPADFYLSRIRAEAQVWAARAWRTADPAQAEALAAAAADAMRPEAADDNAARWWTYAQARGEQAAAEAARGRAAIAAGHARDALAAWRRATPDGAPPGALARWADRDRLLAAASAT